jgi:hypothetical protein
VSELGCVVVAVATGSDDQSERNLLSTRHYEERDTRAPQRLGRKRLALPEPNAEVRHKTAPHPKLGCC